MSDKRAFEGVWIPADLWLSKDMSLQEKVMLVEIKSLSADPVRGCYKSNKAFAEFFNLSTSRVSEIISGLEKKGYLNITQKRDGKRIVERNIFVSEGVFGIPKGYSENTANPIRNPEGGYSENTKGSSTDKSNTLRDIQSTPSRAPSKKIDFSSWPTEPSPQILSDWKKTRKAALTQTAVDRMAAQLHEAARLGYTVDHCLAVCCEKSWRGFECEWLLNYESRRRGANNPRTRDRSVIDMVTDTGW